MLIRARKEASERGLIAHVARHDANILKFCSQCGVGKLVYVSSVHAIPEKPKGTEIAETTTFSPELVRGDYAKSKAMATALVLQAAKEGLNASVVFPSGIIGPGDLGKGSITNMLLSFLAGKLPLAVKGGYDVCTACKSNLR